jgi:hypothetical protein
VDFICCDKMVSILQNQGMWKWHIHVDRMFWSDLLYGDSVHCCVILFFRVTFFQCGCCSCCGIVLNTCSCSLKVISLMRMYTYLEKLYYVKAKTYIIITNSFWYYTYIHRSSDCLVTKHSRFCQSPTCPKFILYNSSKTMRGLKFKLLQLINISSVNR